jgi:hypothetical protein
MIVGLVVVRLVRFLHNRRTRSSARRPPGASSHLIAPAVAHCAQSLFLLVPQGEALGGTSVAVFALFQVVVLLDLQIVDLLIEGVPQLLTWIACPRHRGC